MTSLRIMLASFESIFFNREILVFVSAKTDVGAAPPLEPVVDPAGRFRPPVTIPGRVATFEGDPFAVVLLEAPLPVVAVLEVNADW